MSSNTTTEEQSWILVTGGCGYIGSHTVLGMLRAHHSVVVVDNLCNSSKVSLDRVATILNLSEGERKERLVFVEADVADEIAMRERVFTITKFRACIHFAGLKAVGESTQLPLKYYFNNLVSTLVLLKLMQEYGCNQIVFSSSATVYGAVDSMPIMEDTPVGLGITNPYGKTKFMLEEILRDAQKSLVGTPSRLYVAVLRYFNPVGAHPSGLIGEDPNGIPNNLMPYVSQVAVGRREYLTIFGNDYPTKDGTGVRDYLHVMDLADGHLSAIQYLQRQMDHDKVVLSGGTYTFNLGTGSGYSVLDMVRAMEKATGREIKCKIGPRRPGDIAICYADASLAKREMGWEAKLGLDEMCRDLWCWQQKNPLGFSSNEN